MLWYARYLLLHAYYYARFIGMMPFAIDRKAGGVFRVRCSRGITIYSAVANLCIFAKLEYIYNPKVIELLRQRVQPLHMAIYFVVTLLRAFAMVVSIGFAWKRRGELMAVIREFLQLREDYFSRLETQPLLERRFDLLIGRKFVLSTIADCCTWMVVMDLLRDTINADVYVTVSAVTLVGSYLNTVLNLYYFAINLINCYFHRLNRELLRIMLDLRSLSAQRKHRPAAGVFITLCCQFSDELDALAMAHKQLLLLARRFNMLLDIQGACVITNLYLNNISIVYMCYVLTKSDAYFFRLSPVGGGFLVVGLIVYYWDLQHFLSAMNEMLRVFSESSNLVRQHSLALPLLDERLERCIERFTIQLTIDPLEHNMYGIFKFTVPFAYSLFVSSIVNSIILVQYDYEYY